jgi:hypothetical protein
MLSGFMGSSLRLQPDLRAFGKLGFGLLLATLGVGYRF